MMRLTVTCTTTTFFTVRYYSPNNSRRAPSHPFSSHNNKSVTDIALHVRHLCSYGYFLQSYNAEKSTSHPSTTWILFQTDQARLSHRRQATFRDNSSLRAKLPANQFNQFACFERRKQRHERIFVHGVSGSTCRCLFVNTGMACLLACENLA